ncbi:MAG: DUF1003 domain-containing protein [Burkholderiales bacterium]|nr:DUF1003 domain-containing protein [Burkholderiales bacterium]MDE1926549.1 DUF1003 domain-containing protein [Burkholderiales bacterium]MDE2503511.1 DUF1003 domain-containing protein [Burkholderiales bacterium]
MAPRDASADAIAHNIESIAAFYELEHRKVTRAQRTVEWLSDVAGRPSFLAAIVLFAVAWIAANLGAATLHRRAFDPAPFFWLLGCVSLLALLTTTVVLIRQERLADLEQRREHLDLQVNLLTEQKTTKLIHLIEELRRDMPMVRDRRDPESEMMQQATDPHRVLAGIDEALIAAGDRNAGVEA